MTDAELDEIEAWAIDTEHPCPIRCSHGREPADRCDTCNGDNTRELVVEVRRLRALIKAAEWASYHENLGGDEGVCPWCDFELADCVGHDASCPAFTETGVVR